MLTPTTTFPISLRAGQTGIIAFASADGTSLADLRGAVSVQGQTVELTREADRLIIPPTLAPGLHLMEVRAAGLTIIYQHVEVLPSPLGAAPGSVSYEVSVATTPVLSVTVSAPQGPAGANGKDGRDGQDGKDGAIFTPAVSWDGTLSWTNDSSLPNPDAVNIRGPRGADGAATDVSTATPEGTADLASVNIVIFSRRYTPRPGAKILQVRLPFRVSLPAGGFVPTPYYLYLFIETITGEWHHLATSDNAIAQVLDTEGVWNFTDLALPDSPDDEVAPGITWGDLDPCFSTFFCNGDNLQTRLLLMWSADRGSVYDNLVSLDTLINAPNLPKLGLRVCSRPADPDSFVYSNGGKVSSTVQCKFVASYCEDGAGAGEQGPPGKDGKDGAPGPYFTPSVSPEGLLSWSNNGNLPNPAAVNIRGPQGPKGDPGSSSSGSGGSALTSEQAQLLQKLSELESSGVLALLQDQKQSQALQNLANLQESGVIQDLLNYNVAVGSATRGLAPRYISLYQGPSLDLDEVEGALEYISVGYFYGLTLKEDSYTLRKFGMPLTVTIGLNIQTGFDKTQLQNLYYVPFFGKIDHNPIRGDLQHGYLDFPNFQFFRLGDWSRVDSDSPDFSPASELEIKGEKILLLPLHFPDVDYSNKLPNEHFVAGCAFSQSPTYYEDYSPFDAFPLSIPYFENLYGQSSSWENLGLFVDTGADDDGTYHPKLYLPKIGVSYMAPGRCLYLTLAQEKKLAQLLGETAINKTLDTYCSFTLPKEDNPFEKS